MSEMPIRKFPDADTCASSRVRPETTVLKGDDVSAGAAGPCGSVALHMRTTGCAFRSLSWPDSSSAFTATESVRLACTGSRKYETSPKLLNDPAQLPATGTGAGCVQVSEPAHGSTGCAEPDMRMSCD